MNIGSFLKLAAMGGFAKAAKGEITAIVRNSAGKITSYTEDGVAYTVAYDSSGQNVASVTRTP